MCINKRDNVFLQKNTISNIQKNKDDFPVKGGCGNGGDFRGFCGRTGFFRSCLMSFKIIL